MYAKLTDHVVNNMLNHYVSLASCMGRINERRAALDSLIELIASKQGEAVLFFKREGTCYFSAEFDDVILLTAHEDENGDLLINSHSQLPESGASIIIDMIGKAIQIKTLEWHVNWIDRQQEIAKRGMRAVHDLGKVLNNTASPQAFTPPTSSLT